jgi:hypothetical protein
VSNWSDVTLAEALGFLFTRLFCPRRDLLLENLALRQQLGVFKRKHPRPPFGAADKLFWVMLRQVWVGWERALILIQPETVVRWHRKGFGLYCLKPAHSDLSKAVGKLF